MALLLASVLPLLADDGSTWVDSGVSDPDTAVLDGYVDQPTSRLDVEQERKVRRPQHDSFDHDLSDPEQHERKKEFLEGGQRSSLGHKLLDDQRPGSSDKKDDDIETSSSSQTATQSVHDDNFRLPPLPKFRPTIMASLLPTDDKIAVGALEGNHKHDLGGGNLNKVEGVDDQGTQNFRKTEIEGAPAYVRGKNPLLGRLEEAMQNILSRTHDDSRDSSHRLRSENDVPEGGPLEVGNSDPKKERDTSHLSSSLDSDPARGTGKAKGDAGDASSATVRKAQNEKLMHRDDPIDDAGAEVLLERKATKQTLLKHKRQHRAGEAVIQDYDNLDDDKYPVGDTGVKTEYGNEGASSSGPDLAVSENRTRQSHSRDDVLSTDANSAVITMDDLAHDDASKMPAKTEPIGSETNHDASSIKIRREESKDKDSTTLEEVTIHDGKVDDVVDNSTDTKSVNDTIKQTQSIDPLTEQNSTDAMKDANIKPEATTGELPEDEDDDLNARVSVDYASKSAGAQIIEKSASFKGTSNLLNGDRDKYAIAPCQEKKFVVVSLSEDIRVEVIILANYERFSSTVQNFQVMGSQTLGKWVDLGTYEAASGHGEQTFPLRNPTWARYLKFKFLTHHGAEYYCTLSQIKVHGSTVVEGFHEQWTNEDENKPPDASEQESAITIEPSKDKESIGESSKDVLTATTMSDNVSSIESEIVTDEASNQSSSNATNSINSSTGKFSSRGDFQPSRALLEYLQGNGDIKNLFGELYILIPSALGSMQSRSRMSAGLGAPARGPKTMQTIGQTSIQPLGSIISPVFGSEGIARKDATSTIATPKMNDSTDEVSRRRFGTRLDPLLNLWNISFGSPTPRNTKGLDTADTPLKAPPQVALDMEDTVPEHVNEDSTDAKEDSIFVDEDPTIDEASKKVDLAFTNFVTDLPSAACLKSLDLVAFKAAALASRKSSGSGGQSQGALETPIYQMLMDQIVTLQTTLSAHDQFAKASVGCYQRVLLDLAQEMEKSKREQDERLERLEKLMSESGILQLLDAVHEKLATAGEALVSNAAQLYKKMIYERIASCKQSCACLPGTLFPFVLPYWYQIRKALHSMNDDSIFNKTMSPWVLKMDHLIEKLGPVSSASSQTEDCASLRDGMPQWPEGFYSPWSVYYDEGMWTIPVLSVMLVLLVCRLIMCCTGSSSASSGLTPKPRRNQHGSNVGGGLGQPTNGHSSDPKSPPSESSASPSKGRRRRSRANKGKGTNSDCAEEIKAVTTQVDGPSNGDDIPALQDENCEMPPEHNGEGHG